MTVGHIVQIHERKFPFCLWKHKPVQSLICSYSHDTMQACINIIQLHLPSSLLGISRSIPIRLINKQFMSLSNQSSANSLINSFSSKPAWKLKTWRDPPTHTLKMQQITLLYLPHPPPNSKIKLYGRSYFYYHSSLLKK